MKMLYFGRQYFDYVPFELKLMDFRANDSILGQDINKRQTH